jgi:uncharacterized membrane protein YdjX (TVP38/TMEM64 family)/Tfp pilus assembly protein PilZ
MSQEIDKNLLRDIIRVVLTVAFFSAMALLLARPEFRKLFFDIDTIQSVLRGSERTSGYVFSGLVFTLAGGGLIALGVPRLWASAVGGIIYGAFIGSILSILAALFGASVVYLAGKFIFAAVVERRVGDKARIWKARFQQNAFWWVIYGRLFPFSNSTVMSLLCGSCSVPFIPFVMGSLVGFVPLAVAFATYGSGDTKGNIWQIGFATLLLVLSIFLRRLLRRWSHTMYASSATSDRRVHARKSCLSSVAYQIGGRIHRDLVRNISAGGLLIETEGEFVVGQEVLLAFMKPSFGTQTKVMAQIAWIGPHRVGLRFKANSKEVTREGKVKRKRLIWDRSLSDKVTRYRVYWARDGGMDYNSDYVEVGNVPQVILPDEIPFFPSVADEMEVGVSAISEAGNESEITKIVVSVDFTVPESANNLRLEDFQNNP